MIFVLWLFTDVLGTVLILFGISFISCVVSIHKNHPHWDHKGDQ
jgi:hypothetical protein